ncbi:MAG: cisplatin damage response ATP-dependent DNA ligase [Pseudomonadota bacterium]|nr:cisplatin damage response ATP-dependent DNA ligase [Pseudomonadota bacterium]
MLAFAQLLDRLLLTGSTLGKRRLMVDYFKSRADPERGFALAALAGALVFPLAKPRLVRDLVTARVDPVLFALSRDYVGDMAETVALIWPAPDEPVTHPPSLEEVVQALSKTDRRQLAEDLAGWLDALDASGRWALLKLITGNIRIGVSARLAKTALADAFGSDADDIEHLWHGLAPPYLNLFAWLEGRAEKPSPTHRAAFLPMMLAHALEPDELRKLDLAQFQIELKWDGIRVQLVRRGGEVALYSRTGDAITHTFPELASAAGVLAAEDFVLDGELLALRNGEVAPFNALQQRLNRKKVSPAMLADYPAHIRLYDMLVDKGDDLRAQSLKNRRLHLEAWQARHTPTFADLSAIIPAATYEEIEAIRSQARVETRHGVEGLMLKRLDSAYIAGRPRGPWFKWKRNTLTLDCVLMYAQRGSGKRSSFYSDYTFGVWQEGKLVPVGKAYSGFTDEELHALDKWIRAHTVNRFGPVREVAPELVLEIEFDSMHPSLRHKSGVAMRFPRVHRIRWDKPAAEADHIEQARAQIVS